MIFINVDVLVVQNFLWLDILPEGIPGYPWQYWPLNTEVIGQMSSIIFYNLIKEISEENK